MLRSPITLEAIQETIKVFLHSISPGPGGLIYVHSRTFQPILTPHMCTLFKGFVHDQPISTSMVLTPKKKDVSKFANFQPEALLNPKLKNSKMFQ